MGILTCCAAADWVILAGLLTLFGYLYLTWTFSHWKNKGVPFVPPQVLFGNIKDSLMGRRFIGDVYQDLYHQLKGHKYAGIFKLRQPALFICDPELIKNVLIKDFASFHDNDVLQVTVEDDPMMGRNPFCMPGDRWKVVRAQLTPAFTAAKVRPLFPLINEVCEGLKTFLTTHLTDEDGLEAKEVAAKFTTDVAATCTFGLNGNSFTDPKAEFREMGRRLLEPDFWKNMKHMTIMYIPSLARLLKFRFFDETVANFFRGVVKEAMTYREKNKVTRNDFLQLLMQLKAKGSVDDHVTGQGSCPEVTDEDVVAHASTIFSEGFETSSTTLAHALYELALNPEVLDRLRGELDAALASNGGVLNYEMTQTLPYLEMVIAETLRKYPPASFLNRVSTKPYDLATPDGGVCHLEVGTSVVVPVRAIHHDAQYYPEPERFDPERFTESAKEGRHKMVYLPWGEGPRICPGIRFALTQTKAGLAAIVSNFDLKVNKRTRVPLVADPNLFILSALGGIWLNFSPRAASG